MATEFNWNDIDPSRPFVDSATSAFVGDELTGYYDKIYEVQYPSDLMAQGLIIPYKEFPGFAGDDRIVITTATAVGMAEVIAKSESGGPPVTEVSTKASFNIETQSNTANISFSDVVVSKQRNRPLDTTGLKLLKKAEERYFGVRGWVGDPDYGLEGLHTIRVPEYILPSDPYALTDANIATRFYTDIITSMIQNAGIAVGSNVTNDKSRIPKIWVMSTNMLSYFSNLFLPGTGTSVLDKVIEFINNLSGSPLEIIVADECKNVMLEGYSQPREVGYFLPYDNEKLCLGDFYSFELYPPECRGLNMSVVSVFRTSLVIAQDPFSVLRIVLPLPA